MKSSLPILLVAGEESGDWLAAQLVQALRAKETRFAFFGIGGENLRRAGCDCFQDIRDLAVMGLSDVLRRLPFFLRLLRRTMGEVAKRPTCAAILVDYPGFNLRLASALARRNIPVFFYVVPQVWAWHKSRAQVLARTGKRIFSLFPFEPDLLAPLGIHAEYVGHPLTEVFRRLRSQPPDPLPWPEGTPRLALLPGSRPAEIARHLPAMLEAAARLEISHPRLSAVIACPSPSAARAMEREVRQWMWRRPSRLAVIGGQTRELLLQATAAAVASGTVTLEAALARCPMVIGYRLSPISYWAAKMVVHVPHIGLVNLIAGRRICPELIQHRFHAAALAQALHPLLDDTPQRREMMEGLTHVVGRMDYPRPAETAAERIVAELRPLLS